MSRSPVEWTPEAEDDLTRIYNDYADLHNEITSATHAIDTKLERDPRQFGECRPDDSGVGFEPPLGVEFRLGKPIKSRQSLAAEEAAERGRLIFIRVEEQMR